MAIIAMCLSFYISHAGVNYAPGRGGYWGVSSAVMPFNDVRGFEPVRKRTGCPSVLLSPDFWLLPLAMLD